MAAFGLYSDMVRVRDFTSRRASSWDRTGGNCDWVSIPAGGTHRLLDAAGAGCVKRFYWTYIQDNEAPRRDLLRGTVLRMFWDRQPRPSVEVPLGDFFGVTHGLLRPLNSLAFCTSPGFVREKNRSWGFCCHLPMPFGDGARVELENQGGAPIGIWYHLDYEQYSSGLLPEDTGRLHAFWNCENPTAAVPLPMGEKQGHNLSGDENYVLLDTVGDGQYAGCFLSVNNRTHEWWGEGDDMIFVDGEPFPPSLHGTGTEEIFGGGACPVAEYCTPYSGFHCIEHRGGIAWHGNTGMYRFLINDPVRFRRSIRVTIEHGHANDFASDYMSVAFWYLKGLCKDLPALPSYSDRPTPP